MFISSKINCLVRLNDGREFRIPRGYIGEIPDEVADSLLVKWAIAGGDIVTPAAHADTAIEAADADAAPKKSRRKKA